MLKRPRFRTQLKKYEIVIYANIQIEYPNISLKLMTYNILHTKSLTF